MRKGAGGTKQQIRDLQRDLRKLGYLETGIDGKFGTATEAGIKALQFDLINNRGTGPDGVAPVRVRDYNQSRVTQQVNGVIDQGLVACIADMLADEAFCKIPSARNPRAANARIAEQLGALETSDVPLPFLLGVLRQESGMKHYREPAAENDDNLVVVGVDGMTSRQPAITSRGYGVGQYTLFHHPPTASEMRDIILDPVQNISKAIRKLRDKFDHFVNGNTPGTRADERQAECGRDPLRLCRHAPDDPRRMRDCRQCLAGAGKADIVAGVTRLHDGASRFYSPTTCHPEAAYQGVPIRKNIGCDWPYAVRRYNGGGMDSYHYQAEVLLHVLNG